MPRRNCRSALSRRQGPDAFAILACCPGKHPILPSLDDLRLYASRCTTRKLVVIPTSPTSATLYPPPSRPVPCSPRSTAGRCAYQPAITAASQNAKELSRGQTNGRWPAIYPILRSHSRCTQGTGWLWSASRSERHFESLELGLKPKRAFDVDFEFFEEFR